MLTPDCKKVRLKPENVRFDLELDDVTKTKSNYSTSSRRDRDRGDGCRVHGPTSDSIWNERDGGTGTVTVTVTEGEHNNLINSWASQSQIESSQSQNVDIDYNFETFRSSDFIEQKNILQK